MDAVNPLNYAPRPRAAQRFWRWAYRLIFVAAIVVAAIEWGPGLWRHAQSLYWEQKCLNFLQPPGHVVFGIGQSGLVHTELCVPRIRFEGINQRSTNVYDSTIYLHEMRRSDGTRCLISLTWSPSYPTHKLQLQWLEWSVSLSPVLFRWNVVEVTTGPGILYAGWKIFAGQPDANNPSHFTFDYEAQGTRHTCDAWLNNDGQLLVSPRP
jgi:hypothetical protein